MPRIILPSISRDDRELTVTGQNLKYLRDVLRISPGDEVSVLDGKGLALNTVVRTVGRKHLVLEVLGSGSIDTESSLHLVLIQGLLKGDKMDLVIQKTTELGVREIFPVVTSRSQVRFSRKLGHWRKVAEEATRQSGRLLVPEVHEVCRLDDVFAHIEPESLRIVFRERGNNGPGIPASSSSPVVCYMVGPEGGFTDEEIRQAEAVGFIGAGLGRRTLRAETASIVGAAIIQFVLGDLSG
ncbi:MAG: 16S rRNA (uracil(1498)-N(3))-methyltransferase [Nitrospirae bacterium]|nr:16S rRNA (uracil(1498)-N(3))-methyltransferase [Nitrospirota bacterium]